MSVYQRSKIESLFEFDIDEFITLTTLTEMLKLDLRQTTSWGAMQWTSFVDKYCIVRLKLLQFENEDGWLEMSKEMVQQFSTAQLFKEPDMRRTIAVNYIRGDSLFEGANTEQ